MLLQEIDSFGVKQESNGSKIWLEKLIIGAKIWLEKPILPPPPGVFGKECAAVTKEMGCGKL
jgi:hypothetical protein